VVWADEVQEVQQVQLQAAKMGGVSSNVHSTYKKTPTGGRDEGGGGGGGATASSSCASA
jgi:hypothetical protein